VAMMLRVVSILSCSSAEWLVRGFGRAWET
jgi:hypothetical protein